MDGNSDAEHDPMGLFGRPLFNDPEARKLSRVGVVDVGSNSVRLVIFDGAARSPAYFYNEKVLCGLGSGLGETGRLNPEGKARALDAIRRFQTLAEGLDLAPLSAVATAAVREAEDGPAFREEIARETGLRLYVIDGPEEARLSAQGVLLGWPWARGVVCDIGGSSMELAAVADGKVGKRQTTPLGPLKLQTLAGRRKDLRAHVDTVLRETIDKMGMAGERLYLVGGSWRAIARLDMARRDYPLRVLHEYGMQPDALAATLDHLIATDDLEGLRGNAGVGSERMALVPLASEVLSGLLRVLRPPEIFVSSYGLREGLLYEQMPQKLRDRDPLIEACLWAESHDARVPGFGRVLYHFLRPLFAGAQPAKLRLVRAACLLHDVSWRAHPDYRAQVCFDNATRANLGGLKHSERVFLGLALLHRYSNKRENSRFSDLDSLISEQDKNDAEIVGKAMRFAAMLWLQKNARLGELRWFPKKKVLELRLSDEAAPLYGEVAQSRFAALAAALGAEAVLR